MTLIQTLNAENNQYIELGSYYFIDHIRYYDLDLPVVDLDDEVPDVYAREDVLDNLDALRVRQHGVIRTSNIKILKVHDFN